MEKVSWQRERQTNETEEGGRRKNGLKERAAPR